MTPFRIAALLGPLALALAAPVLAQPAVTVVPLTRPDNATWHVMPLKNVPPSRMAYWLDPAHNPLPQLYKVPGPYGMNAPKMTQEATTQAPAKGAFELPKTIVRLVPFEPNDLLLIEGGNADDVRHLRDLATALDQPLRQIEMEAQFIELDPTDLETFKVGFADPTKRLDGTSQTQIGFVRGNFQARLDALIATEKVKVISSPRVTAINNMSAILGFTSGSGKPGSLDMRSPMLENKVGANVTPTINGDDTVTIAGQLFRQLAIENSKMSSVNFVVNVRDGDTIVVQSPLLSPTADADPTREVVAFITPRIIRRAGE